ncbi:MAG: hypothetical protein [Olavius algarvensis Gamma 3 endosymbiont]|nr:MAG: hypothetical protein [Olavius algarvensis Gamma 3 endosymbiont]
MEIRFPNTSSTVGIMIYSGQQCAQAGISQRATIARSRLVGRDDCRFGNRGDI